MKGRGALLVIAFIFTVTGGVLGDRASAQAAPITYDFDWQSSTTGTVLNGWFTLNDGVTGPATVSEVSAFEVQLTNSLGEMTGPFLFPGSTFTLFSFDTTTLELSAFRIDSILGFISLNQPPNPLTLSYFGNTANGASGQEPAPAFIMAVQKPVPTPAAFLLMGTGLIGLIGYRKYLMHT